MKLAGGLASYDALARCSGQRAASEILPTAGLAI